MRVWAGALTEAACSVETYLPLHRHLDDDGVLHDLYAVGMPISPPLVRAACPRQNAEKC
jgi:hypothetical protein